MSLPVQIALGLVLSGMIGVAAHRRGSLALSGIAGAVVVGTVIFGFGGLEWGLLLILFFVSSSLLSHFREAEKSRVAAEKFDKGHRRDFWQALANAGAGALLALLYTFHPVPAVMAAFIATMATVTADTWATELGVLSRDLPRLITTWKLVEKGTSGAVSVRGTLATSAGALLIGFAAMLFFSAYESAQSALSGGQAPWWPIFLGMAWTLPVALAGGLAGSLFDSLLGATAQAMYYSPYRQKETEKRIDPNGQPNVFLRGWAWLDNDAVNFVSSLVGAAVGALAWWLLGSL
ncbi:MAG: DUF92 domain-containing protein [Anaerolineae bacterium]|nr:DUF92 domain-containing protein [Anaerolineae bacterium]